MHVLQNPPCDASNQAQIEFQHCGGVLHVSRVSFQSIDCIDALTNLHLQFMIKELETTLACFGFMGQMCHVQTAEKTSPFPELQKRVMIVKARADLELLSQCLIMFIH